MATGRPSWRSTWSAGITAMTGAAAVLIGGTTLHSYLGIGLGKDSEDDLVKKINGREKLKRKWRDTNVLVVDEVSMLPADLFDKLNRIAKRVRKRSEPFGGMQLVFGGDFLQLPCIKGDFCFESKAWKECRFEIFHLTKIMRQADKQFQACLNRARFGEMTDEDFEYVTQSVPTKEKIASMEIKPTRILCENVDVNEINQTKLEQLPAEEIHKYKYKIEYNLDNYKPRVHQYMFKDVTKLCNAQPKLSLSVGAQVMLLANLLAYVMLILLFQEKDFRTWWHIALLSLLQVAAAAHRYVEQINANLPPSVQVKVSYDRTEDYLERINLLRYNGVIGLLLVLMPHVGI